MDTYYDYSEGVYYITGLGRSVRCRLEYEVSEFRPGLLRWFLIHIEILE